jgi:hypothetical protein
MEEKMSDNRSDVVPLEDFTAAIEARDNYHDRLVEAQRDVGNYKTELLTLKQLFDEANDAADGGRKMYHEIQRFAKAAGILGAFEDRDAPKLALCPDGFVPFTREDFLAAISSDGRPEVLGIMVTQRQYEATGHFRGTLLPNYVVPYNERVKSDDEIHTIPERAEGAFADCDIRVWRRIREGEEENDA